MKYRTIGTDSTTRREVSVLALGAMLFGSVTDEKTSFAILDRYVEAGGTFIDTSNNYAFWVDGGQGGQSEELLGRWRRSRGIGDEIVIATKLGARPLAPGTSYAGNAEGLSAWRSGSRPSAAGNGSAWTRSTYFMRTSRIGRCRSATPSRASASWWRRARLGCSA